MDGIMVNNIRVESIIPSQAPTLEPTQVPTDIFGPIRTISDESTFDFV